MAVTAEGGKIFCGSPWPSRGGSLASTIFPIQYNKCCSKLQDFVIHRTRIHIFITATLDLRFPERSLRWKALVEWRSGGRAQRNLDKVAAEERASAASVSRRAVSCPCAAACGPKQVAHLCECATCPSSLILAGPAGVCRGVPNAPVCTVHLSAKRGKHQQARPDPPFCAL